VSQYRSFTDKFTTTQRHPNTTTQKKNEHIRALHPAGHRGQMVRTLDGEKLLPFGAGRA